MLQTSWDETIDRKSEENELNERNNETVGRNDEHTESLYNKEGKGHITSNEYYDHVKLGDKNESEVTDKAGNSHEYQDMGPYHGTEHLGSERHGSERHGSENRGTGHHGSEHHGMDNDGGADDGNKNSFQMENKLASESGDGYKDTQVVDSTQENIKHSADHSVASSGFESLNQSNNNTHDIERTEKNFGVTIADKENLGICQYVLMPNLVNVSNSNLNISYIILI